MNAPHNTLPSPSPLNTLLTEAARRLNNPNSVPLALRVSMGAVIAATLVLFLGALVGMGGCESDSVGRTTTTEKRVVDTPTEKTTTTETTTKDTHYVK